MDAVQEQYRYSVFIAILFIISVKMNALKFISSVNGALVTLFNMQACFFDLKVFFMFVLFVFLCCAFEL